MTIVPLYYFAADLAKQRLEAGEFQLGAQQPPLLLLARPPVAGKMQIRDLSRAPLLLEGGPSMLRGMVSQACEALNDGEHLILMAETVLREDGAAVPALLIWVSSPTAQMLGVNPVLPGGPAPTLDIRKPAALQPTPGEASGTLFPSSRTLH